MKLDCHQNIETVMSMTIPRRSCRKRSKVPTKISKPTDISEKKIKIEKSDAPIKDEFVNTDFNAVPMKVESFSKVKTSIVKEEKPKTKNSRKSPSKMNSVGNGIRPTQEESRYATTYLSLLHPQVVNKNFDNRKTMLESCGMRDSITDAIVSTMLSQNTTDKNSKEAYKSLKENFPTWQSVVQCNDISKIEDSIRVAGLAKTRAERIQAMLRKVKEERGVASLNYVRDLNDEDVKQELGRFKGLGPKTISCVLLFALGRPEFPVDTHVLRITQKMGWVGPKATREGAYEYLNKMVPDDIKMDLHCLLVRHGKVCHKCASNNRPQFPPKNGKPLVCPLVKVPSWLGIVPKSFSGQNETEMMMQHKKMIKLEGV